MSTGLDFTTLARVRAVIGLDVADTSRDTQIERLIHAISAQMEDELRRFALQAANVEILAVWPARPTFTLSGVPVLDTPAPALLISPTRDFTGDFSAMTRGIDYVLENDTGKVRLLTQFRGIRDPFSGEVISPNYVKATYTGGLAEDTPSFLAAYPQLAESAELQVAYVYQREKSPGGNITVGASHTSFDRGYDWLPSVARNLNYHKKRSVF